MEFTEQEKALLFCAFDVGGDINIDYCKICIIKDKCSSLDEGNGFSLMGQELLKKLGLL